MLMDKINTMQLENDIDSKIGTSLTRNVTNQAVKKQEDP